LLVSRTASSSFFSFFPCLCFVRPLWGRCSPGGSMSTLFQVFFRRPTTPCSPFYLGRFRLSYVPPPPHRNRVRAFRSPAGSPHPGSLSPPISRFHNSPLPPPRRGPQVILNYCVRPGTSFLPPPGAVRPLFAFPGMAGILGCRFPIHPPWRWAGGTVFDPILQPSRFLLVFPLFVWCPPTPPAVVRSRCVSRYDTTFSVLGACNIPLPLFFPKPTRFQLSFFPSDPALYREIPRTLSLVTRKHSPVIGPPHCVLHSLSSQVLFICCRPSLAFLFLPRSSKAFFSPHPVEVTTPPLFPSPFPYPLFFLPGPPPFQVVLQTEAQTLPRHDFFPFFRSPRSPKGSSSICP